MKQQTIEIKGMTCGHCVMTVRKELGKLNGVTIDEVKIGTAVVQVDETTVSAQVLQNAVTEAGYSVVSIH
jgi:copper chaperone